MLIGDKIFPFPRIVRAEDDIRGNSIASSDYHSPIAQFLQEFSDYSKEIPSISKFEPKIKKRINRTSDERNAKKIEENYSLIKELLKNFHNEKFFEDSECNFLEPINFRSRGFMAILSKFDSIYGEENGKNHSRRDKAIDRITKNTDINELHRLLLFSSYITSHVVLTCVETHEHSGAFDIFDSLNTTGEPLTAIETLKPQVVEYENREDRYDNSESQEAFNEISEHIDSQHQNTETKQRVTKETIITFATYLEGYKLSKELGHQRNYLKDRYSQAIKATHPKDKKVTTAFVKGIADTAHFRRYYWDKKNIDELARFHSGENLQIVQLCMSFIAGMNTSLALPVLLRYWSRDIKNIGDHEFIEVVKAVTAFLAIRRGATGVTAGIDAQFRNIMLPVDNNGKQRLGLCAGVDHKNYIIPVDKLKDGLRNLLNQIPGRQSFRNKEEWVQNVIYNPLASQSKPLCRFLLLAAADGSVSDESNVGLWNRDGVIHRSDIEWLKYEHWKGQHYATVEHIAPEKSGDQSWGDVYRHGDLIDTLGNLTLLPSSENSSFSNKGWSKKRVFYRALVAKTVEERSKYFEDAKKEGISIPERTIKILEDRQGLPLLQPLIDIEEWSENFVRERSRNIAELAWDRLWPWLK